MPHNIVPGGSGGGGGGGVDSYPQLLNKPQINGVTLQGGNNTPASLRIAVTDENGKIKIEQLPDEIAVNEISSDTDVIDIADGKILGVDGGKVVGVDSEEGGPGQDGKSTYDLWLEAGHTGTVDDFLRWVKAEAGGFGNVGEIFDWPLEIPPGDSWFCDGSKDKLIADGPELFKLIGTKYGGDGITTFGIPDCRGEFRRGYDPEGVRDPNGKTRGIGKHQNGTLLPEVVPYRETQARNRTGLQYALVETEHTGHFAKDRDTDEVISPMRTINMPTSNLTEYAVSGMGYKTRPTNVNLMPCIRYKKQEAITVAGILAKVEYASNDDNSLDNAGLGSAINSENGSPGLITDKDSDITLEKKIIFPTPYNSLTDILDLQVSTDGKFWTSLMNRSQIRGGGIASLTPFSTGSSCGMGIVVNSLTGEMHVGYGRYRNMTVSWSSFAPGWYWRAVKKTFVTNPVPLVMSPHKWDPGKEYLFEDGSYGQRFVGTITAAEHVYNSLVLISGAGNFRVINSGGWWESLNNYHVLNTAYVNNNVSTEIVLSFVEVGKSGNLMLRTRAVFQRTNDPYDIWIRYTKTTNNTSAWTGSPEGLSIPHIPCIPNGGLAGQQLTKKTDADYDTEWKAASSYTHTQDTPAKDWHIQHNLGLMPTNVLTRDDSGEQIVGFVDHAASTTNLLIIRFSEPLAGSAIIN